MEFHRNSDNSGEVSPETPQKIVLNISNNIQDIVNFS